MDVFYSEVIRRKWLLLLVFAVVFSVSFLFLYDKNKKYQSSVQLLINETDLIELSTPSAYKADAFMTSGYNTSRMLLFVKSTVVLKSVVKNLKLAKHYGLDERDSTSFQIAINYLSSRSRARTIEMGILELLVIDSDQIMAEKIANQFVLELNSFNNSIIIDQLKRKNNMYNSLYEFSKAEEEIQRQALKILFDSLLARQSHDGRELLKWDYISSEYLKLVKGIETNAREKIRIKELYSLVEQQIKSNNFNTITVLREAYTEDKKMLEKSLLISFIITFFSLYALIFIFMNHHQIRLFFK